jgi:hypothetical protein
MSENRLFVSGALLDRWVTVGQVELGESVLEVKRTGTRYALEEAAHIVKEVTGAGDPGGLVGRVRTLSDLSTLGAEVLDRSLVLGDVAYDVVPGFMAARLGASGAKVSSSQVLDELSLLASPRRALQTDEELLARFLIEKL